MPAQAASTPASRQSPGQGVREGSAQGDCPEQVRRCWSPDTHLGHLPPGSTFLPSVVGWGGASSSSSTEQCGPQACLLCHLKSLDLSEPGCPSGEHSQFPPPGLGSTSAPGRKGRAGLAVTELKEGAAASLTGQERG